MRTPIPTKLCLRAALFIFCVAALAPQSVAERLPIKIFTSADGLGSSFINSLMRDSRGFLWVCTRDGLSRFDGSRFVTYQIGDNGAPPGIEQILETRKGVYWISTTGGLFRFDPDAPLTAHESKSADRATLKAEFVSDERGALYEDHAGNLWLGSNNLYRLLEKDNKAVFEKIELGLPVNPSNSFGILAISEGRDGSLWLATSWGLVRRFADGKQVYYSIDDPRANALTSILLDRDGRIWVGREKGGVVIKPESSAELSLHEALTIRNLDKLAREGTSKDHINLPEKPGEILKYSDAEGVVSGRVSFLYQTADGHIWISTTKGVIDFDGRTFHAYTSAQGFIGIFHFIEDASENLWLGGVNGLVRLDRGGLTSYFSDDGLSNPYILVINKTIDDKLYAMGGDLSLSLFDGKRFQTIHPQLPSDAQALWTANPVFQDSAGEWWFLTNGKLFRFAATNDFRELARQRPGATYDRSDGLSGDQMFHIFEDSRGDLWISTHGIQQQFGLSRWNRATGKFYTFTDAEGFPANRAPSSFAEDRRGNIFLGFYEGGLVRYAEGRFTQFTPADGLPGGLITALYLDRQGRLWIGSAQSGLSRVDDPSAPHPRFVSFTAESGMASNNVRSITEDLYGNIYAGTARGIDRLSPDASRIKHYSVSDGLAGDFVSTAFRDAGGALWFGTPNGLSRLVPRPDKSLTPPPVWVSGLRIAGERRAVSELGSTEIPLLELADSQNNLQIDFFGIDFSAGGPLRYQYKLEGADQDWGVPTDQRTVTYARLQPGAYRFLVRAVNADGHASDKPAIVSFRILAPIWLRWWFISLAALLAGALFFSLYRYRMARLREVNVALAEAKRAEEELGRAREERLAELERVRTRIATDLHDDIGASLTQIAILSEVAQQQNKASSGAVAQPLQIISNVSNELVGTMSDIVWAINPQRDHLRDLTQRMRRFASDVLPAKGIAFGFDAPPAESDLPLGTNLRREVFLIFKESLNNIVKHSNATRADIELNFSVEHLTLKIADNGSGFESEKNTRALFANDRGGNGIFSMKRRAREMNGELEITSEVGKGAVVVLRLPLEAKAPDAH